MQDLVWTKVCHLIGESYPMSSGMKNTMQLDLQKKFVDRIWETSLVEMVQMIGDAWNPTDGFGYLSAETNRERDKYAEEITSFARASEIEIAGAIDAAGSLAAYALCAIGEENGTLLPAPDRVVWRPTEKFGNNK